MASRHLVGLSCLLISIPTSGGATPIVDQNFSPTPGTMSAVLSTSGDSTFAQSFTVGVAGLLTGADLLVFDGSGVFGSGGPLASDVGVQIRTLVAGVPTDDVLAAGIIPAALLPVDPQNLFSHVDFAGGVTVLQGETLALTITGVADGWLGQVAGQATYAGGEAFTRAHAASPWQPFAATDPGGRPGDFLFRTYVDPAPVPEPGTVTLVALGLAGGMTRYRRRFARR